MYVLSLRWLLVALMLSVAPTTQAEPINADARHLDVLVVNPSLQLRDVLDKTFARNPQQAALQSLESVVQARNLIATATLPATPAIILGHQNDVLGSGRGESDWQAELELPVWMPNQRNHRMKVAAASKSNIIASRDSLKLQVAGLLRDALWDVAFNNNNLELTGNKLEATNQLLRDVEKRFNAGELAKTDLMFAQQEALRAEKEKLRAEAELMHARHRYFVLTGLRELPASYEEKQSSLEDFNLSPIWLESQSKLGLAESERDLASIESRENMQLVLNARRTQGAFDNTFNDSVGLKVRIPFGGEGRSAMIKASSEAVLGSAQSEHEALRLVLETNLHEAEHNLNVSRDELNIASKQFAIAQDSLKLAQKAFKLGESDLVSLLRVQAQTFETERAFNTRQIQLQWDIARYNQAVGVLP